MPDKSKGLMPWIAGTALLAVLALLIWQGPWSSPADDGDWSYPELAPEIDDAGEIARGTSESTADVVLEDGAPISAELRLTPRAQLLVAGRRFGNESLEFLSRITKGRGRTAASCRLRFLAGLPAAETVREIPSTDTHFQHLGGLPRGRFVLQVDRGADSKQLFETVIRLPRKGRVEVDWGKLGALRGRVEDDRGRGLKDATVEVQGRSLKTDADGRFQVSGLVAGSSVPVIVRAPRRLLYCEMVEVGPKPSDLRFVLPPAWTLRVTAPTEDPASIAVVPASGGARFFPYYAIRPRALGRGRFEIDGLPVGHSVGVAVVDASRVCRAPTQVKAPLRARVIDAVVKADAVATVAGRIRVQGEDPGDRAASLIVEARDDRKERPWGETLFVGDALIPPAWAALGTCRARPAPNGHYRIGMPGRRTRLSVEPPRGLVGESRVLYRAKRLRADFDLVQRESDLPEDFEFDSLADLSLHFTELPARVRPLEVQIYWAGQPRGKAVRHDPRKALVIPLPRPSELEVVLRRRGGSRGFRTVMRTGAGFDAKLDVPYSWLEDS